MDRGIEKPLLFAISFSLFLSPGCATTGKSIGMGAGAGALLGAGVGAMADPGLRGKNRIRNILIGTAAGGVVGAGTGYAADRIVSNEKEEAYQKGKTESQKDISERANSPDGSAPRLIPAKTDARWIPDQVRGQIFIPGHFEYVILEGSRWEMTR